MVLDAEPLPLDSRRWADLSTRNGPGAERVADGLRDLTDGPFDASAFGQLWPEVCSEGQTYDAAFAATPYLAALAEQLVPSEAIECLIVIGLIATSAGEVPTDLNAAYEQSLHRSKRLALARLADCPIDHTLRYLLAAVAAFRGRRDLAQVLQDIDAISEDCPTCGTVVFPAELQQVIDNDHRG